MTTQTGVTTEHSAHIEESSRAPHDVTRLYREGLIAGLVGATTVCSCSSSSGSSRARCYSRSRSCVPSRGPRSWWPTCWRPRGDGQPF